MTGLSVFSDSVITATHPHSANAPRTVAVLARFLPPAPTADTEIARIEKESASRAMFAPMTEERVATILVNLADDIEQAGANDCERIKDVLLALVSRFTLDPKTNRCEVEYQIDVTENSNKLASPRGRGTNPLNIIRLSRKVVC